MSDILNFISDPAERRKLLSSTLDVLNRGVVAGTLRAPVDLMNLGINAVKAGCMAMQATRWALLSAPDMPERLTEKPVGGSEWIAEQMQKRSLFLATTATLRRILGRSIGCLQAQQLQFRAPQIAAGLLKLRRT